MVDITYRGVQRVSIVVPCCGSANLKWSAVREPWRAATSPSAQGRSLWTLGAGGTSYFSPFRGRVSKEALCPGEYTRISNWSLPSCDFPAPMVLMR